jgi:hypothetical protein
VEVNWPGRESDHSFLFSAVVRNVWSYATTSPYVFIAQERLYVMTSPKVVETSYLYRAQLSKNFSTLTSDDGNSSSFRNVLKQETRV